MNQLGGDGSGALVLTRQAWLMWLKATGAEKAAPASAAAQTTRLTFTDFGPQQGLELLWCLLKGQHCRSQTTHARIRVLWSEVGHWGCNMGLILAQGSFNTCFTDRDDLTVTLQRFPRDTKLEEVIDT